MYSIRLSHLSRNQQLIPDNGIEFELVFNSEILLEFARFTIYACFAGQHLRANEKSTIFLPPVSIKWWILDWFFFLDTNEITQTLGRLINLMERVLEIAISSEIYAIDSIKTGATFESSPIASCRIPRWKSTCEWLTRSHRFFFLTKEFENDQIKKLISLRVASRSKLKSREMGMKCIRAVFFHF